MCPLEKDCCSYYYFQTISVLLSTVFIWNVIVERERRKNIAEEQIHGYRDTTILWPSWTMIATPNNLHESMESRSP